MTSHDHMAATVDAYAAGFANQDADAIAALYAEDATVTDPAGTPPHVGRDAIRAFYAYSVGLGAKVTLDGPVRSAGDIAAFAFHVLVPQEGGVTTRIDVIDLFRFNEAGLIQSMTAYWSDANLSLTA